ncbi:MAG: glycerol kinase, partial [Clostridia bacterium]
GTVIDRPFTVETTAMGAAFLACIGEGIFSSYDKIRTLRKTEMLFPPEIDDIARSQYKSEWTCAINRIRSKI